MRALKMSWNTEQGRLICRWVESREFEQWGRLPASNSLRLSDKNQSTRQFTRPSRQSVPGLVRVA
jgi:hypothetical protein